MLMAGPLEATLRIFFLTNPFFISVFLIATLKMKAQKAKSDLYNSLLKGMGAKSRGKPGKGMLNSQPKGVGKCRKEYGRWV